MNVIAFLSKRETQEEKEIRERREKWLTWNDYRPSRPSIPIGTFKLPTSAPSAKASGGRIGGSNWGA